MSIVSPFIGDFLTPVGQPLVLSPLVNGLRAEFDQQQFRINGGGVLFDTAFNITRSSSKYEFGTGANTGVLVETPPNEPAYKHDPVTGAPLGLSVEGSAVRLNTIAAAPTVAENVTVSAVQHTISFFGTGTMTLSGAHSATVVGDGAFPTRTEYTFAATAGTLTLTPSGDIQHLQLETGAKATSPIIGNEGSQATRDADIVTSDAATFGDWFSSSEGTFVVEFYYTEQPTAMLLSVDNGLNTTRYAVFVTSIGQVVLQSRDSGSIDTVNLGIAAIGLNKVTFDFSGLTIKGKLNGGSTQSMTVTSLPSVITTARFGREALGGLPFSGEIKSLTSQDEATL